MTVHQRNSNNGTPKTRIGMLLFGTSAAVEITPADHSAADLLLLGDVPVGTCALRPVLPSEVPPIVDPADAMMLVCKSTEGDKYWSIIDMPPHRRMNTPANVQHGVDRITRRNRDAGIMFALLSRGSPLPEISDND